MKKIVSGVARVPIDLAFMLFNPFVSVRVDCIMLVCRVSQLVTTKSFNNNNRRGRKELDKKIAPLRYMVREAR